MRPFYRSAFVVVLCALFILGAVSFAAAQSGTAPAATQPASGTGERTVEEAYLQASMENMIISEQSHSDSRDMKRLALTYAEDAIKRGHKSDEIRQSLEYLALEATLSPTRDAGLGRVLNDYPDIRADACRFLGEFGTVEAKDALLKVALSDQEPMVLAAAVRSLGKIGMNDNDEVAITISYVINRFDVLRPDNTLAFECLVALDKLAAKGGGIKDQGTIRAIMKIATGNYITIVKQKAKDVLDKFMGASSSTGTGSAATTAPAATTPAAGAKKP